MDSMIRGLVGFVYFSVVLLFFNSALANCNQLVTTVAAQNVNGSLPLDPVFNYQINGATDCGVFLDGSKWVAGDNLSIVGITGNGGTIGADFDPVGTDKQGFFVADYGNYSAEENIILSLPYAVDTSEETVLVSAFKRSESQTCGTKSIKAKGCVEAYDFLTFLPTPPPANSIRPSYLKAASKLVTSYDSLRHYLLPVVEQFPEVSGEELLAVAGRWRHVLEIGGQYSEGGRAFRPHAIVQNYASTRSANMYTDFAKLLSETTDEAAKKQAIASYYAYSRDIFYAWVNPNTRGWLPGKTTELKSGAGQFTGSITPANFYGVLGGSAVDETLLSSMIEDREISYQEHRQVNPGINGPVWGDLCGSTTENLRRYWDGVSKSSCNQNYPDTCNPSDSGGKRTCRDPHSMIDGPERANYGLSYIGVTLGPYRDWCTITRVFPEMGHLFNYDDFCVYVDRVMDDGYKTSSDTCAATPAEEQAVGCSAFFVLDWTKPVTGAGGWQSQCCRKSADPAACEENTTFGETWGPVHGNLSQCIQGTGRYTEIDGAQIPLRNGSPLWGSVYEYFRANPNVPKGHGDTCACVSDAMLSAPSLTVR